MKIGKKENNVSEKGLVTCENMFFQCPLRDLINKLIGPV